MVWGGNEKCAHNWQLEEKRTGQQHWNTGGAVIPTKERTWRNGGVVKQGFCSLCGAWRGAYGLEPTPEMYVKHTIEFLRAIRRVLRKDGCVFLNIGDSYAGSGKYPDPKFGAGRNNQPKGYKGDAIIKPKDLCLIPFRVAIEAQRDGWWVRSVIVWSKLNPMPESCRDRPTESHEYILMLTKSPHYYWDADAVRERTGLEASWEEYNKALGVNWAGKMEDGILVEYGRGKKHQVAPTLTHPLGRNLRSVWTFNEDETQGGNLYKVLSGCPIHSPLLHPLIQQRLASGEPQDCLLSHTFDRYSCLVPVLSASLLSKICHDNPEEGKALLSKMGFHHHGSVSWQIPENVGDNKKLNLCFPAFGQEFYPEIGDHTKHIQISDELLPCNLDYLSLADVPIATEHNKEIHRIVSLIAVGDNIYAQIPDHIAHILQSLGCVCCSYSNYTQSHFAMSSLWTFSTEPYKNAHFATFPRELPKRCILAASKEGDIILDPFSGSGTVGEVAKSLGRKATLIDTSAEYCSLAQKRVEAISLPLKGIEC